MSETLRQTEIYYVIEKLLASMGNAGCCTKGEQLPPPGEKKLPAQVTILGDYFDRDTRSLLGMCDLADIKPNFQIVDVFNGGNLEQSYEDSYGTKRIPIIKIGTRMQIRGQDGRQLFQFLLEQQARIRLRLYCQEQAALMYEI